MRAARKASGKATNSAMNVPASAIWMVWIVAPTTVWGKVLAHQAALRRAASPSRGTGAKSSHTVSSGGTS
ncbi:hypothetical protein D3C72_2240070 [compost metagenome]